jgi:hypothetical protein
LLLSKPRPSSNVRSVTNSSLKQVQVVSLLLFLLDIIPMWMLNWISDSGQLAALTDILKTYLGQKAKIYHAYSFYWDGKLRYKGSMVGRTCVCAHSKDGTTIHSGNRSLFTLTPYTLYLTDFHCRELKLKPEQRDWKSAHANLLHVLFP